MHYKHLHSNAIFFAQVRQQGLLSHFLCFFSTTFMILPTLEIRDLKEFRTSVVYKVCLKDEKFYMIFRSPFSFILSYARQWAVFFDSRMFSELAKRSQSLDIKLSEYLSFSIKGRTFSRKTWKVFSSPKRRFGRSENLIRASGIILKIIFGSFRFSSWKNCLTNPSISESWSWNRIAI